MVKFKYRPSVEEGMKSGETAADPIDGERAVMDAARDTRRKAAFLLRKPFVEQHEVYVLAKAFFKAYLRKEYEFTADELRKELHKIYLSTVVRERVEALVEKLGLLEYTDTQYSQAELKFLLQDLDGIVEMLVVERRRQLPFLTRVANWLFRKSPREARATVISEYPVVEDADPVTVELNTILEDVYLELEKGNARKAAKLYKALLGKYDRLGVTAQHRLYHKVNAAYEAIAKRQA